MREAPASTGLRASRRLVHAFPRRRIPAQQLRRAQRPRTEAAATIRAASMQHRLHAGGAKRALERTDHRPRRIRRQVAIAALAIRAHLKHGVLLDRGHRFSARKSARSQASAAHHASLKVCPHHASFLRGCSSMNAAINSRTSLRWRSDRARTPRTQGDPCSLTWAGHDLLGPARSLGRLAAVLQFMRRHVHHSRQCLEVVRLRKVLAETTRMTSAG